MHLRPTVAARFTIPPSPRRCDQAAMLTDLNALPLPDLFRELAASGGIDRAVACAVAEDLGLAPGMEAAPISPRADATSFVAARTGIMTADLVCRERGVLAGLLLAPMILARLAPSAEWTEHARDGERLAPGQTVATLRAEAREVLAAERTLLNFIARLSGVATAAASFVGALGPSRARVYDTRKTTPGLRHLEKYAVRCGGAYCHRIGLFDAVLIKDNHLAGVSVQELPRFVGAARERAAGLRIRFFEVEVTSLQQFEALLTLPAGTIDVVLLDNMPHDAMRRAAALRDERAPGLQLEASGGVRLGTIAAIGATGVDRISVGAMTHHAVSLDVALEARP